MNAVHRLAVVALLILNAVVPASAKKKSRPASTPNKAQIEAATHPQIFLDRANFSPGKIDGRYNDVTLKALALYRQSRGEQPQTPPAQDRGKPKGTPDVSGLDLASVDPVSFHTPSPKRISKR